MQAKQVERVAGQLREMQDSEGGRGTGGTPPVGEQDLRLAVLLVRLLDRVKQTVREVGDELGLSIPQLEVLRRLHSQGPLPMSRLAELLNCEASNLTGLVDRLEARGLMERQTDPHDRRVRRLALTDAGRKVTHKAWFAIAARCPFKEFPQDGKDRLEEQLQAVLSQATEEI